MESSRRIHTGILGGSFNPVHAGHIMLASYLAQFVGLDEVWLMLSPANPLKEKTSDVTDAQRLEMLRLACQGHSGIAPTDIELTMPRPSYTINSLSRLSDLYPERDFSLIIGSDNWLIFDRWRNSREIIERFSPIIYPRPGYEVERGSLAEGVTLVDAPQIEVSSSFIRRGISDGKDMSAFLPDAVARYIEKENLYSARREEDVNTKVMND